MGITYFDATVLWDARLSGVSFTDTLTVANLALNLHANEVRSLRHAYFTHTRTSVEDPLRDYAFGGNSDRFLKGFLGASSLSILDYSDYEGATVIHDLNVPVPERLHDRFDAVIDGGSLEHVFNFPIAIANLMKMVKTGGHIFLKSPANNLCGHGFYQFSPELMFRVFTPKNGFQLDRVVLLEGTFPSVELTRYRGAYEVRDPESAKTRVGLTSKRPVVMMVQARKIADVPVFAEPPLQSDYVTEWSRTAAATASGWTLNGMLRASLKKLPFVLRSRLSGHRELRRHSLSNRAVYRKLRK